MSTPTYFNCYICRSLPTGNFFLQKLARPIIAFHPKIIIFAEYSSIEVDSDEKNNMCSQPHFVCLHAWCSLIHCAGVDYRRHRFFSHLTYWLIPIATSLFDRDATKAHVISIIEIHLTMEPTTAENSCHCYCSCSHHTAPSTIRRN